MAIGNWQQGTIAPESGVAVRGKLGAADTWSYLLVVIMDCEHAQGAAGWATVRDLHGAVLGPAEDALKVVYMGSGRQRITSSLTLANFALSASLMGCSRSRTSMSE